MPEPLFAAVQMKFIKMITWRKHFAYHSWYGSACHLKGQERWKSLPQQPLHLCKKKFWIFFLLPSIENKFGDDAVNSYYASFHRAKKVKHLKEKWIKSIALPAKCLDINLWHRIGLRDRPRYEYVKYT